MKVILYTILYIDRNRDTRERVFLSYIYVHCACFTYIMFLLINDFYSDD